MYFSIELSTWIMNNYICLPEKEKTVTALKLAAN